MSTLSITPVVNQRPKGCFHWLPSPYPELSYRYIVNHSYPTYHTVAMNWTHHDKYLTSVILNYLPDPEVDSNYRHHIRMFKTKVMVVYIHINDPDLIPTPSNMNHKVKLIGLKRFRANLTTSYIRAVFAHATEGELHEVSACMRYMFDCDAPKPGYVIITHIHQDVWAFEFDEYSSLNLPSFFINMRGPLDI